MINQHPHTHTLKYYGSNLDPGNTSTLFLPDPTLSVELPPSRSPSPAGLNRVTHAKNRSQALRVCMCENICRLHALGKQQHTYPTCSLPRPLRPTIAVFTRRTTAMNWKIIRHSLDRLRCVRLLQHCSKFQAFERVCSNETSSAGTEQTSTTDD